MLGCISGVNLELYGIMENNMETTIMIYIGVYIGVNLEAHLTEEPQIAGVIIHEFCQDNVHTGRSRILGRIVNTKFIACYQVPRSY